MNTVFRKTHQKPGTLHFLGIGALFSLLGGCQSPQPASPPASNPATPTSAAKTSVAKTATATTKAAKTPTQMPPRAAKTAQPTARPSQTTRASSQAKGALPFGHKDAIYSIATSQKVFALTFDDGPDPTYTPKVLALLKQYQVPATFFMVGSMVRAHPATALQVKAAGFPTENHSWSHPRAPKLPAREVTRTDAIMLATLGTRPTLFRPPYGMIHNGMAQVAHQEGEKVVIWSCLGADWDKKNTSAQIAAKVLRRARPGGIALLHDGGGNRSRTLAALPTIIETLQRRGFRFVTVSELLQLGVPAPVPARTPVPIPVPTFSPTPLPISRAVRLPNSAAAPH